MAETTDPNLTVSEELVAELHKRLDAHRASPEQSETWEVVDKEIFGDD
ncbi:MAG TPA: addiction module protein [Thermoanaerobaculia bacterium]|jgi:putative addiction module component (TIGR02574 family)|nr:addiction module protein [Thermoanaerobaculia bacterium]